MSVKSLHLKELMRYPRPSMAKDRCYSWFSNGQRGRRQMCICCCASQCGRCTPSFFPPLASRSDDKWAMMKFHSFSLPRHFTSFRSTSIIPGAVPLRKPTRCLGEEIKWLTLKVHEMFLNCKLWQSVSPVGNTHFSTQEGTEIQSLSWIFTSLTIYHHTSLKNPLRSESLLCWRIS